MSNSYFVCELTFMYIYLSVLDVDDNVLECRVEYLLCVEEVPDDQEYCRQSYQVSIHQNCHVCDENFFLTLVLHKSEISSCN